MPVMKIYIAGPISAYKNHNYNIAAFREAAKAIEEHGHEAVVPHDLVAPLDLHPENDYDTIMEICLEELQQCQAVAMLPNWRESNGAKQEYVHALQRNIPVKEVLMWVQQFRDDKRRKVA